MPANQRHQTTQSPVSPNSKATAKYTNKDGSKLITVPKSFNPSDSSENSPAMAHATAKTNGQIVMPLTNGSDPAPTVNRKKQKRREKQAARLAAEQMANSQTTNNNNAAPHQVKQRIEELKARFREHGLEQRYSENGSFSPADGENYYTDEDGDAYSAYGRDGSPADYEAAGSNTTNRKSKKKKKNNKSSRPETQDLPSNSNGSSHNHVSLPLPPLPTPTTIQRGPGISKEKIWNTSSQEERERIKEFWLSLGEDERKSLVKVEKDAVLKKMKEQQKHSCSCTVCGRKRTAIEEELEVLYDAYYEELEQYANHQGDGRPPPMMPPPRRFGPMSGIQPNRALPPSFNGQQPSRGRIVEQLGDDEDDEGDEEYSEDDADEEDFSDDEPEELPRSHATDFFNFGNSLTVQGGILTVADDLLKNDGKKFIEMMEQLAERRMAREEDAKEQYSNANYGHPPNGSMHSHTHTHNHPPPPDDEEYDDEDEEEDEFDSQDDYEDEEMESMTEEQRMEEGRRMFQIFAARMFEQRVLTAYKEKVAKERQQKLLEELEEESRADSQKKAKKAKDAQKKKDKVQQKKLALAEEKAKREAEKAAEEAAIKAEEEKKTEEARLKSEEKRKKKEAIRKAEEEDRLKKETEKQRRLQEQKDRQAEQDKRLREAKEKERKEKEELRIKDKESKEAKEREAKDRKDLQEREKKEQEARSKSERDTKDQQQNQPAAQTPLAAATPATVLPTSKKPVPIPTNLQPHPAAIASPQIAVATPVVPKAPTPIKLRSSSQQDAHSSVPLTPLTATMSQNASPHPPTPLGGSPAQAGQLGKPPAQLPFLHHPQANSPMHAALKAPPGVQSVPFAGMNAMGMGYQTGAPAAAPGFGGRMHHEPVFPHQPPMGGIFRPLSGPNGVPMLPGMNMQQMPQGRGFPMQHGPPGFPQQIPNGLGGIGQAIGQGIGLGGIGQGFPTQKDLPAVQPHSRHQSASYDKPFEPHGPAQAQPIARPGPIGRPSSVVHGHYHGDKSKNDVDDLSNHLGSSALLDDSDEPLSSGPGRPIGVPRPPFAPQFGMEHSAFAGPASPYNSWGGPPNPFGPSSLPGANYMAAGWGPLSNGSFGAVGANSGMRSSQPRSVTVRQMVCRACKNLEGSTLDRFIDINAIRDQLERFSLLNEQLVSEREILDICETEGNSINGGGSFEIRKDSPSSFSIRFEPEAPISHRPLGAPGDIGSPIVGSGSLSRFPGPPGLSSGNF